MTIQEFVQSVVEQLRPFGVKEVRFKLVAGPWFDDGDARTACVEHGGGELEFTVRIEGAAGNE